ncbi:MAG: peroxidase [Pyrinomonadaceae bacterium]|nr:peroxidase [Pyrinomonadaceae bacterium]
MAELKAEDMQDIQGFVISGYAHLPCVSYLLLGISDPPSARGWLARLVNEVTTSEGKELISCLNVALTHRGLRRMGLDEETLDTFSRPFVEGMATQHRSRILGDGTENGPTNWDWGGNLTSEPAKPDETKAVDILLLLFGRDETTLDKLVNEHRARLAQCGLTLVLPLGAGRQPDIHEHFGFADGMGQPAIEGTIQTRDAAPRNVIKTGEILLGYVNDYGKLADSPTLRADLDPQDVLHDQPPVDPTEQARPSGASPPVMRDLGRNGTYLVFRQLAQHVAKFCHYLDEATRTLDEELDSTASDRLAAKFVGRWQNGAPLVLSPDTDDPALSKEDDFGYRDSDAHGFKCPIGSHVRRSNPRDSIGPDAAKALATANRHRILRRGRSYGVRPEDRRVDDGVPRGLHFLCLNADIERQFEFVQQTWINNPVFGGLDGEVDPLVGNLTKGDEIFTVQADPLRTRVHNLERFVTVKGGAYFFLPSLRALRYLASL